MGLHVKTTDYDCGIYDGRISLPHWVNEDNKYLLQLAAKGKSYGACELLRKIAILAGSEGDKENKAHAIATMAYVAERILHGILDGAEFVVDS